MDCTASGLYTDFYELTMAQGYFYAGKKDERATFDLFFRTAPFHGGYAVFAGLEQAVRSALAFRYNDEDCEYLSRLGFRPEFLSYLAGFRFSGDIDAFPEGEIAFPENILVRVTAPVIEAQLLESMLLNIINFQTLIATKTMRVVYAARGKSIIDFGLRRAQAGASMAATRAAFIGGVLGTSNTLAARQFGIPAIGTHAHSWIQSFPNEYEAFSAYARQYPRSTTLLVDTYDTLRSGVPNAIRVAKEMESRGETLQAIRLDSGDMAYLSKKARALLDAAGLPQVKIVASNQLDEHLIESILDQDAPIDSFGVGTRLICSYDQPALDGIYKLCQIEGRPKIKFSEVPEKINNPGKKTVIRYSDGRGRFLIDALALDDEPLESIKVLRHPFVDYRMTAIDRSACTTERLLRPVIRHGELACGFPALQTIQAYASERFLRLPDEHKRFANPHTYRVGLSEKLHRLRHELIEKRLTDSTS